MESEIGDADSILATIASTPALTGPAVAGLVDDHLAALWRGEEAADHPFFAWLASCWRAEPGPEPANPAAARSVLAAGGLGISWFDTPGAIIGFIPGHRQGYYRVSPLATPPSKQEQPARRQIDAGPPRRAVKRA